jgi:lipid-A-disaccharide synthase
MSSANGIPASQLPSGSPAARTGRLYALLAAEPSGDFQAAALVEHIRGLDPQARFLGIGGRHLRQAGVELLTDTSQWGTIGPFEVVFKLPRIIMAYYRLKRALLERRPDVTVMIDSPALFMRLARFTRPNNLKTVYYFPPSAWSDSEPRARSIAARVDGVVCAFERQYRTYRRAGLPARYFGHPVIDVVKPRSRPQALQALGLGEGRYISLMPGSRSQEIRIMTPILLQAARQLRLLQPDLQFLVPAASDAAYARLQSLLEGSGAVLFNGRAQELLSVSEASIMTSGSVSLEALCLDVPMVVGYRFNALDALLASILLKTGKLRFPFSLPNLLLGENVVTELYQTEVTAQRLVEETLPILRGGSARERMLADLRRARELLGTAPVVSRVAEYVAAMAGASSLPCAGEQPPAPGDRAQQA